MMRIEHLPVSGTDEVNRSVLGSLRMQAAAWIQVCADYYAASIMYEQLAGLSDAELLRRGLSRDTIAHHAINVCTRHD